MPLENDQFQVTVTEDHGYTIGSADNKLYDIVWNPMELKRSNYIKKALSIEVYQEEKVYRGVLLIESYVFNEDCVILTDSRLTVLGLQSLIQLDLVSREVLFCRELSVLGDTMAIYPCPEGIDGYVIWGELEIIKLNENFELEWTTSGADIFISQNEEPPFQMTQDRILLNDWEGNHYEVDFQGHTLVFQPNKV